MYDLGQEIDEFRHDIRDITIRGGVSRGIVDSRTRRWLFGCRRKRTIRATDLKPQPVLLPPDRKLVYPWIGWQVVADDFREMTELNDMGRTEDIALGINLFASIGFAANVRFRPRRVAAARDARLRARKQAGRATWSTLAPSTGRATSTTVQVSVTQLGRALLPAQFREPAAEPLVGRARGPRAGSGNKFYSAATMACAAIRSAIGRENRLLFTAEERFYTDFYPWRLFRFGYAAFFDAGRVTGRDPRASAPLGTLYDVGFGPAPHVAAREPRPDPAHRSRVPDQRAGDDRQGAADRRDERQFLTPTRNG